MTTMQNTLTYKGIEKVLLARFPELKGLVDKTFGSYYDLKIETPEAYPVFESVLRAFLFDLLDLRKDEPLLHRIFSFLEEMANSPDENVTDLLGIAILEPLVFDRGRIRNAWKYMGESTKKLAAETARAGGWQENLPSAEAGSNGH
jgi:hypothetical protein